MEELRIPGDHGASASGSQEIEPHVEVKTQNQRDLLHSVLSYKMDENPEVVRHLVQTLGLIGPEGSELDALSMARGSQINLEVDGINLDRNKSSSVISV